ncbi:MAG: glycosyltransferase [Planctomycetota bacterium]|nr:glycosyltransferase [Planctomycetota bacterium]
MRILMLGWEFPPFIAGGLGVACYGLTRALDSRGHRITFVLPRPVNRSYPSHVRMLSPESVQPGSRIADMQPRLSLARDAFHAPGVEEALRTDGFQNVTFRAVPAAFANPYEGGDPIGSTNWVRLSEGEMPVPAKDDETAKKMLASTAVAKPPISGKASAALTGGGGGYGNDLVADADRYARLVVALAKDEQYDVIHAHDWLTFPAAIALSRVSGKPLVVHLHSTEFDRAGNNVNQRVYDIERAGMQQADRIITVSQLTKSICVRRYAVPPQKVDVVYNGLEQEAVQPQPGTQIENEDKLVLFLGRITMQKGPEYFIAAAKRVLEKMENVKFVLAGSGDMALRMIELAASMGIGHKVLFTGFLRGKDVDRVFAMADCYVMPSVSEPFGLAALEAIHHDVPVIVSKTSGVAEVLNHVLKVDFWDVDEMANKIIAVLRHPPLGQTLRQHGSMELRRLTWTGAGEKCEQVYQKAIDSQRAHAV